MALGIMALGSSCGGTLFPIIIRNLINAVGCVLLAFLRTFRGLTFDNSFQWTMRIMGFIEIVLCCTMVAVSVQFRMPLFY